MHLTQSYHTATTVSANTATKGISIRPGIPYSSSIPEWAKIIANKQKKKLKIMFQRSQDDSEYKTLHRLHMSIFIIPILVTQNKS